MLNPNTNLMNKALTVFSLLFGVLFCSAQNEWTMIHPTTGTNNFQDVHFNSEMEGWVVGTDGIILYTNDGGVSWDTQHSNEDESFWSVFFIDDIEGWAVGWDDIYHTTDKGDTWTRQSRPPVSGDLMDVFFINQDTGWVVGTYRIILKTVNGGENWTKIMGTTANDKSFHHVEFVNDSVGCAVGGQMFSDGGFIMRTTDGGLNWTELPIGEYGGFKKIHFLDSVTGWICGYDRKLLKTTDAGLTWVEKGGLTNYPDDICFFDEMNGFISNGGQAWLTFDGGESWDSLVYTNSSNASHISCFEYNKCVLSGYGGTIIKSTDGASSWVSLTSSMRSPIKDIGFFNENFGLGITNSSYSRLISTYDGGHSWDYDTINSIFEYNQFKVYGTLGCLLDYNGHMLKSNNSGESWEIYDLPDIGEDKLFTDFQFINENVAFFCSYNGVLWETNNGGDSWIDRSFSDDYNLRKVHFVNEDLGWLIDHTEKNLLKTDNGGLSWTIEQFGDVYIFQPVDIFFVNENVGYLSTEEGILYKTIDGGDIWIEDFVFPSLSYSKIHFIDENEGWIKTHSSVSHTIDGGETWFNQQTFDYTSLRAMFFLDDYNAWLGGGYGLTAKSDFTVDIDNSLFEKETIKLFPNPATDYFEIDLVNENEKITEIKVVDIHGKCILHFSEINEFRYYKIDVSELLSGTYIIQIITDTEEIFKKFVVQ